MADEIPISGLDPVSVPAGTDIFPVVQGGTTKYESVSQAMTGGGAAIGASSSTANEIPVYSDTAGKNLGRSGVTALAGIITALGITLSGFSGILNASSGSVSAVTPAASSVFVTSAGSVPSFSQALPSIVQDNITRLGTVTTVGSVFGSAIGGTGNGFTKFSGAASSEKTYTLANASCKILTDNDLVTFAQGGTNANLTAVNGGIFYSTASAAAISLGTPTASQVLLSGAFASPTWSAATYPSAVGVNQILYGSSNNVIGLIATNNSSVLVTSNVGVPSFSASLPAAVQQNIFNLSTITLGVWHGSTIEGGYGGTNNAFMQFSGPATSLKTFTLPNASDTIACLGQVNAFTAQQYFAEQALTDASPIAWNLQTQQSARVLLTAGVGATRQLQNPTNLVAGGVYYLKVTQSSGGANALTYGANYKFPGGVAPTLSTAANAVDMLVFISDGTNMYGTAQFNYS